MIRMVGIGSPFGDDQLGWRVAELLKQEPRLNLYLNQNLDIQISDRPGLALIMTMDGIKTLYLVDALKASDNQIGQICRINSENLLNQEEKFFSTHSFNVASAIALAKVLKNPLPETIIYAIKIDAIHYETLLSPLIAKACQELADQLIEELLIQLR